MDDQNTLHLICDKCFKPLPTVDITIPINYARRSGFREGIFVGIMVGGLICGVVTFIVH